MFLSLDDPGQPHTVLDHRFHCFDVPAEALTGIVMGARTTDATRAEVREIVASKTTLRHVLGARVLQDVIERREEVAQSIEEIIAGVATSWGVKVESILIKDINFSRELQDSLSMAAQSKRIGESKVRG